MDVLAVVPATAPLARRLIAGQPLAVHALDQALSARHVTRVAMITGDPGLARDAERKGCEIVAPPERSHHATAIIAALEAARDKDAYAPALVVVLDPSYPLRSIATVDSATSQLLRSGADTLISVFAVAETLWIQGEGGLALPFDRNPSQHLHVESGVLLAVRTGVFETTGELPAGRTVLFEVPRLEALAVVDEADLAVAEALVKRAVSERARILLKAAKLLVFDFDGVMTDNRVLVGEDDKEAVLCNRGDGLGIDMLRASGFPMAVISKEGNPVVAARCRKLKLPFEQGIDDKIGALSRLIQRNGLDFANVAFMGNDVNDVECLRAAGIGIATADAHPEAKRAADVITVLPGGFGAVREVCDVLLALQSEAAA